MVSLLLASSYLKPTPPTKSTPLLSLIKKSSCHSFLAGENLSSSQFPLSMPKTHAGIFSGFSGIESVPGPLLPSIDFLSGYNEENQKKYAENDARFKQSPLLKKLLEQTKLNQEKNRQQILDKYCVRGAEWGVGDCSADAMSPEERDRFISSAKQKAGME